MKRIFAMGKRLTWEMIQKKYPSQWVGLVDCDMDRGIDVISGIVKYTENEKSSDEMALEAVQKGNLVVRYTTPKDEICMGALMA